jgi:predicted acylesterase/phospholipase RssA
MGRLKGVLHAVVVERLCKQYPQLLDFVDCFAGTSGGAIIASALAAGYPPVFARQVSFFFWLSPSPILSFSSVPFPV